MLLLGLLCVRAPVQLRGCGATFRCVGMSLCGTGRSSLRVCGGGLVPPWMLLCVSAPVWLCGNGATLHCVDVCLFESGLLLYDTCIVVKL